MRVRLLIPEPAPMPLHDWTRVPAGIYHAFHLDWIGALQRSLNSGRMPEGYYALAEQAFTEEDEDDDISRRFGPDVLALQVGDDSGGWSDSGPGGGTAVAEAPPAVALKRAMPSEEAMPDDMAHALRRRSRLAVRHVSGDRLVALVEIVSPGNKHSVREVGRFVDKAVGAVRAGVHVLLVDPFPPGPRDPDGLHGLIGGRLGDRFRLDPAKPLTFASYVADDPPVAYLEPLSVGDAVPDMPLFLDPGHYVTVPLGETYAATFEPFPAKYRAAVEG